MLRFGGVLYSLSTDVVQRKLIFLPHRTCAVGAAALLVLMGVLLGIWACCGRPTCTCTTHEERAAQRAKAEAKGRPRGRPAPTQRSGAFEAANSTEELAAVLSSVLKTHRYVCVEAPLQSHPACTHEQFMAHNINIVCLSTALCNSLA